MGGSDQIFVGFRRVDAPGVNSYMIRLIGMTGVNAAGTSFTDHVNVAPSQVVMFLDRNPMKYWFVANGRRFVVVVKISTVYQAMYGGLFLPYADPLSYPYPLMIGGSAGHDFNTTYNWTTTHAGHSHFTIPYGDGGGAPNRFSSLYFLDPAAQWWEVDTGNRSSATPAIFVAPWKWGGGNGVILDSRNTAVNEMFDRTLECLGGGYALHPATLVQNSPVNQMYGVMDGIYQVPGTGNAAENIVTVDGIDHLVVQNAFRATPMNYWALALE